MKELKRNFLLDYQYATGLILGLLSGWWLQDSVLPMIVFIIMIIIAERVVFR